MVPNSAGKRLKATPKSWAHEQPRWNPSAGVGQQVLSASFMFSAQWWVLLSLDEVARGCPLPLKSPPGHTTDIISGDGARQPVFQTQLHLLSQPLSWPLNKQKHQFPERSFTTLPTWLTPQESIWPIGQRLSDLLFQGYYCFSWLWCKMFIPSDPNLSLRRITLQKNLQMYRDSCTGMETTHTSVKGGPLPEQ